MRKRNLTFTLIFITLTFVILYAFFNVFRKDDYVIAYVLDSSIYDSENDIYNLSLYVPSRDQSYEREMSGIYYREYNITNDQICITFSDIDEVIFIVNFAYCKEN